MNKVIDVTKASVNDLKARLIELHEEYDRAQANDANAQIEIAREITEITAAIKRFEKFLENYIK